MICDQKRLTVGKSLSDSCFQSGPQGEWQGTLIFYAQMGIRNSVVFHHVQTKITYGFSEKIPDFTLDIQGDSTGFLQCQGYKTVPPD
jgi:hypothetical protein